MNEEKKAEKGRRAGVDGCGRLHSPTPRASRLRWRGEGGKGRGHRPKQKETSCFGRPLGRPSHLERVEAPVQVGEQAICVQVARTALSAPLQLPPPRWPQPWEPC